MWTSMRMTIEDHNGQPSENNWGNIQLHLLSFSPLISQHLMREYCIDRSY